MGRIKISKNIDAVYSSVDNILGTKLGERCMLPEFASPLHGFLFDPITPELQNRTANAIKEVVERWDDRVEVLSVSFFAFPDNNQVELVLSLRIRKYSETFQYRRQVVMS